MRLLRLALAFGLLLTACDVGNSASDGIATSGSGATPVVGGAPNGGAASGGATGTTQAGTGFATGGATAVAGAAMGGVGGEIGGSANAGAAGAMSAGGVSGTPSGGTTAAGAGGRTGTTTVTLMTFNVRTQDADSTDVKIGNDWAKRLPLARAVLADHAPAVVGLQEATPGQVTDLAGNYTALPHADVTVLYDPAQVDALEGDVVDVGNYGNMDPWGERFCNWQRFKVRETGEEFVFFDTHLSTAGDNVPQSKFVFDLAQGWVKKGYAAVVVGDFNYDAGANLGAAGWVDAVSDHAGTFHAFAGGRGGPRFDFIGIQGSASVDSGVDTRSSSGVYPSDHYPVWAKLALQ